MLGDTIAFKKEFFSTLLYGGLVISIVVSLGGAITPWLFTKVLGLEYQSASKYAVTALIMVSFQSLATLLQFLLRSRREGWRVVKYEYWGLAMSLISCIVLDIFKADIFSFQIAIIIGAVAIITAVSYHVINLKAE